MSVQEWVALGIVACAAGYAVWRLFKRDGGGGGCGACPKG